MSQCELDPGLRYEEEEVDQSDPKVFAGLRNLLSPGHPVLYPYPE